MYRDAHSHLQPPTPAAQGACGLIPGQKEALSTEGEGTEAETVVHMMCRAVNKHMRTLFPDTHRGARGRGESGRQTQEEAHAIRAWKTEVNRMKTDMDSCLEV